MRVASVGGRGGADGPQTNLAYARPAASESPVGRVDGPGRSGTVTGGAGGAMCGGSTSAEWEGPDGTWADWTVRRSTCIGTEGGTIATAVESVEAITGFDPD